MNGIPSIIVAPDFAVYEQPRADGAQDIALDAVVVTVQVRGSLDGCAPEQHASEETGAGPSRQV